MKKFSGKKKSYQATEMSYWATELLSYQATYLPSYQAERKFPTEKKLPSYRAELLSYRAELLSYRATELPRYWATSMKKISGKKVTKLLSWATELPSYWATKLLSYRHEKNFRNFFSKEKIKLPSYLPTELPGPKKISGRKKLPSYWAKLLSYRATELPSY